MSITFESQSHFHWDLRAPHSRSHSFYIGILFQNKRHSGSEICHRRFDNWLSWWCDFDGTILMLQGWWKRWWENLSFITSFLSWNSTAGDECNGLTESSASLLLSDNSALRSCIDCKLWLAWWPSEPPSTFFQHWTLMLTDVNGEKWDEERCYEFSNIHDFLCSWYHNFISNSVAES